MTGERERVRQGMTLQMKIRKRVMKGEKGLCRVEFREKIRDTGW